MTDPELELLKVKRIALNHASRFTPSRPLRIRCSIRGVLVAMALGAFAALMVAQLLAPAPVA